MMSEKGGHKTKSTHGSIIKAGKVRNQTPKIAKTVKHVKRGPRCDNRRAYEVKMTQEEWKRRGRRW